MKPSVLVRAAGAPFRVAWAVVRGVWAIAWRLVILAFVLSPMLLVTWWASQGIDAAVDGRYERMAARPGAAAVDGGACRIGAWVVQEGAEPVLSDHLVVGRQQQFAILLECDGLLGLAHTPEVDSAGRQDVMAMARSGAAPLIGPLVVPDRYRATWAVGDQADRPGARRYRVLLDGEEIGTVTVRVK